MQTTIRILTMAIALVLMLAGGYVVFEGGVSRTPPLHLNWACFFLGIGLMALGALFALLARRFGRASRVPV
jgi:hypothetical protein